MELFQFVANRIEEVSRPLREEVASLKLLLARVGVSLEPTETCSSGTQELVATSFPLGSAEPKSSVVEITLELYELCEYSFVVTRLQELSGCVVMPPFVEEARFDSHEISVMTSPSSLTFGFEKSGVVDDVVPLMRESNMNVVPIGDGVAKSGLLATVPGAVVAREVCDFLATLVVAYPGSAVD
jgi:hypothetical protein